MLNDDARSFLAHAELEVLAHAGVKGMKWGVRRARKPATQRKASVAGKTVSNATKGHGDHQIVRDNRKRRASQLSNDELRRLNDRMRLENEYRSLKKKDRDRTAANTRTALQVASDAYKLYKSPLGQAGVSYVNSMMNDTTVTQIRPAIGR